MDAQFGVYQRLHVLWMVKDADHADALCFQASTFAAGCCVSNARVAPMPSRPGMNISISTITTSVGIYAQDSLA